MNFSLQEMVRKTIAESDRRIKLAEAESSSEEDKNPNNAGPSATKTPPVNPNTAPERNEESVQNKTSSVRTDYVTKLADAIDYINKNVFTKEAVGEMMPKVPDTQPAASDSVGTGKGPNTTETNLNSPTPGTQNTETGQATKENIIPEQTGSGPSMPGNSAPKTSLDSNYDKVPGGSEEWTKKDVLKQAAVLLEKRKAAQVKIADVPPDATASEEGVPSLPGPASSQAGLVGSNEAAINYTKRQAKAEPKEQMGEVISEPAQVKSTDPVLQNNLSNTGEAGVKVSSKQKTAAAARVLLQKIAEEGSAPDATPEAKAKAEKLQELLKAKEKESQFGAAQTGFNSGMSGF